MRRLWIRVKSEGLGFEGEVLGVPDEVIGLQGERLGVEGEGFECFRVQNAAGQGKAK